ncbi:MAG: sodium:calcium antiporter [Candidatus Woesearchaeota archaeon]
MVITTIALFLGACLLLVLSGWLLVKSLSKISIFLRINEFIVAFIMMAFCTSLPELFVGISSAIQGKPTISLGNVIGSNIVDLTLIAGIAILLARGIRIERKIIPREVFGMVFLTALPMVLMYFGKELSRLDGLILLGAFAIYMYEMVTSKHAQYEKKFKDHISHWTALLTFVIFIVCAIGLYVSSKWVVHYGSELATMLGMPPIIIGLFFVAIGTSLPDLTFSARAVLAKHAPLAIGDLVGAVVVNSTVVLAITALITPITNSFFLFVTSAAFMIAITFLFATFIESGEKLTWKEGVSLILFYIVFVIVELNLQQYFK